MYIAKWIRTMVSKCNLRLIRRCWMVEYGVKGVTLIDTFLDSTWFISSMYFRNALLFLIDCFCIDVFAPANLFLTSAVYNGINFLCMITYNPSKRYRSYHISNVTKSFIPFWHDDALILVWASVDIRRPHHLWCWRFLLAKWI